MPRGQYIRRSTARRLQRYRRVLAYIEAHPGVTLTEIAAALDEPRISVRSVVLDMQSEGAVAGRPVDRPGTPSGPVPLGYWPCDGSEDHATRQHDGCVAAHVDGEPALRMYCELLGGLAEAARHDRAAWLLRPPGAAAPTGTPLARCRTRSAH